MRTITFDIPRTGKRGPDLKPRKIRTHCKYGHERHPEDKGQTCPTCKARHDADYKKRKAHARHQMNEQKAYDELDGHKDFHSFHAGVVAHKKHVREVFKDVIENPDALHDPSILKQKILRLAQG